MQGSTLALQNIYGTKISTLRYNCDTVPPLHLISARCFGTLRVEERFGPAASGDLATIVDTDSKIVALVDGRAGDDDNYMSQ
jgi:hypothetical protein